MYRFGVDYFYSKVASMLEMPEYLALALTAFIVILLIKTGTLTLAGYKSFGMSLLIAAVANVLIVGGLIAFFYFNVIFTTDLMIFCGAMIGGFLVIDLLVTLVFKGRSNFWDGLIGSSLGNLIVASAGLVVVIIELYPLK